MFTVRVDGYRQTDKSDKKPRVIHVMMAYSQRCQGQLMLQMQMGTCGHIYGSVRMEGLVYIHVFPPSTI